MYRSFLFFVLTFIIIAAAVPGRTQETAGKKIVILPFTALGMDAEDVLTAESIFRMELAKQSGMTIVSERQTLDVLQTEICREAACAAETARQAGADYAVMVKFSPLGEKIIVQYYLVDAASAKIVFQDQTNAYTIEDLDTVMKRVAGSIVEYKPISKNAKVGNIMETEAVEPARRASHRNFGLSFGYLFPQEGYDGTSRQFVLDLRTGYEMEDFTVGMLMGFRKGFAVNIYTAYLFSRTDFCPYLGGAFGFHWVSHTHTYDSYYSYREEDQKKGDGFEFTLNGGIRAFRTYNFQFIFNLAYTLTLNDFHDRAVIFTIGLL